MKRAQKNQLILIIINFTYFVPITVCVLTEDGINDKSSETALNNQAFF